MRLGGYVAHCDLPEARDMTEPECAWDPRPFPKHGGDYRSIRKGPYPFRMGITAVVRRTRYFAAHALWLATLERHP